MPTCTFILQNKHCREDVCIKHIHLLKFSQKEFSVRWHLRPEKSSFKEMQLNNDRDYCTTLSHLSSSVWQTRKTCDSHLYHSVLSLCLSLSLSHTHTHTLTALTHRSEENHAQAPEFTWLLSPCQLLLSAPHISVMLCTCAAAAAAHQSHSANFRELQGTSGNKPQSTTPVWGHAWSRGWRRLCRFLLETVEKRRRRRSSTSGRQQGTICCHGDRCVEKSSLISDRSRLDTGHVSPQDEYCRGY